MVQFDIDIPVTYCEMLHNYWRFEVLEVDNITLNQEIMFINAPLTHLCFSRHNCIKEVVCIVIRFSLRPSYNIQGVLSEKQA